MTDREVNKRILGNRAADRGVTSMILPFIFEMSLKRSRSVLGLGIIRAGAFDLAFTMREMRVN